MTKIKSLPTYAGIIPNKKIQTDNKFAQNIYSFLQYNADLTPKLNITINEINTINNEIETLHETLKNIAPLSGGYSQSYLDEKLNSKASREDLAQVSKKASLLGEIKAIYSCLSGTYTIPSSGVVDENGFMYCDGSAIPDNKTLSGSIPNLTDGRFLRGSKTAGSNGGSDKFTLETVNLPEHAHSLNHNHKSITSSSDGNHSHTANHNHSASTNSAGNHAHNVGNNYGNSAGKIGSKYSFKYSGNSSNKVSSSSGSHSHTVTVDTKNLSTSTAGSHSHTITIPSFTGNSGNVGSNKSKTHIPKYIDVQYIIKVD